MTYQVFVSIAEVVTIVADEFAHIGERLPYPGDITRVHLGILCMGMRQYCSEHHVTVM